MKKRIMTLVAALALAATVVAPVEAGTIASPSSEADKSVSASADYTAALSTVSSNYTGTIRNTATGEATTYVNGTKMASKDANGKVKTEGSAINTYSKDVVVPTLEDGLKTSDIKLSGAATQAATTTTVANFVATNSNTVSVGTVGGDMKDNIHDNAIRPAVKEFVENSMKQKVGGDVAGKGTMSNLKGIVFFELKGAQTGDMTIKLPDDMGDAFDNYAIVLHYTGNASDEDGVTAQYVKVSAGGKLTAHFNSYSPVAVIGSNLGSAQTLVNTYNHSIGSDEIGGAAATTTTTATTTPVATPVETTATTATTDANAAAGKTAASPKTGDNAYALYLILAVAAVAGTTLVATKKTR